MSEMCHERTHALQQIRGKNSLSVVQLGEQSLGFLKIERVEAFDEPVVDRREKIAGLLSLALIAPEPRQAHRRAQLPGLCLLRPRYRKRLLEIALRFRHIRLRGL